MIFLGNKTKVRDIVYWDGKEEHIIQSAFLGEDFIYERTAGVDFSKIGINLYRGGNNNSQYNCAVNKIEFCINDEWLCAEYTVTPENKNELDYDLTYICDGQDFKVRMQCIHPPWTNTMWSTIGSFMTKFDGGVGSRAIAGYINSYNSIGAVGSLGQSFCLDFKEAINSGVVKTITGVRCQNSGMGASYQSGGIAIFKGNENSPDLDISTAKGWTLIKSFGKTLETPKNKQLGANELIIVEDL